MSGKDLQTGIVLMCGYSWKRLYWSTLTYQAAGMKRYISYGETPRIPRYTEGKAPATGRVPE